MMHRNRMSFDLVSFSKNPVIWKLRVVTDGTRACKIAFENTNLNGRNICCKNENSYGCYIHDIIDFHVVASKKEIIYRKALTSFAHQLTVYSQIRE